MGELLYKNKYRIPSARLDGWDYGSVGFYFVTICVKNHKCDFGFIKNGGMCLNDLGRVASDEWLKTFELRSYVLCNAFVIMPNHMHAIVVIENNDCKYNHDGGDDYDCGGEHGRDVPRHVSTTVANTNIITPTIKTIANINTMTPVTTAVANTNIIPSSIKTIANINTVSPVTTTVANTNIITPTIKTVANTNINKFGPLPPKSLQSIINHYKGAVKKYANQNSIQFQWQSRFHDHIIRHERALNNIRDYIINNPARWAEDKFFI